MSSWDPKGYLAFEYQRTRPARDLAAQIDLSEPERIIDIGCGPGNSTKVLKDRWPDAEITGLDNSAEMLNKARVTVAGVRWILSDAAEWKTTESFDIVFSNATLHWIPDHDQIVKQLFSLVEPKGVLAVQIPSTYDSPFHGALLEVSGLPEWIRKVEGSRYRITYHDETFYYNLLSSLTNRLDLWTTTYFHILENHQNIVEWYSSTSLKPYLERLQTREEKEDFCKQILDRCKAQYPVQPDGKIAFPFKRLFFTAWKA